MKISFAGEAYESFQAAVREVVNSLPLDVHYFVRITPEDGSDPFDAWLVGAAPRDEEWGDTVQVVRNDDDGSTPPDFATTESVRVDEIHVY